MLYAAKCFWPGVTAVELEQAVARVPGDADAVYMASILFPRDELVLCLFDARSSAAVQHASDQAGLPCERVMETVWFAEPERAANDKGDDD
jgi:hypothetical protein